MRKIIVVLGVAMVATLAAWSLPAGAQGDVHVFYSAATARVQVSDFAGPGSGLGDRLTARGPLLDGSQANAAGTAHQDCVVTRRITDGPDGPGGTYWCNYVLHLAEGDLLVEGLDPHGPGVYTFAVIGGTGAYAGARGDATLTDTADTTEFVIGLPG